MDVQQLRQQTPGCAHRTHLNNAGAGLLSATTLDVMRAQLQLEAEIGGYEAEAAVSDRIAGTRRSLAALVGGRADEIALFDNSTHAWNAAFYSVPPHYYNTEEEIARALEAVAEVAAASTPT